MTCQLSVDELVFEVRRSARRRTIELTVDRGGELILTAPPDVDEATLAGFVRARRLWLYTKLAQMSAVQRSPPEKQYVSGEGFSYLGRSYRLLLVDEQEQPLKLEAGRFRMLSAAALSGREHFVSWYISRGTTWLAPRVAGWAQRMGLQPTRIDVRELGYRWGSCSSSGTVNFHWATLQLPPSALDYIIVHELAHLAEPDHTPDFWLRVGRTLPEYGQRKQWLAENGADIDLL